MSLPTPQQIAESLSSRVVGQDTAVREISVALSKKLAGLAVGNVLLIGSSGSGKTTLMKAVEALLQRAGQAGGAVVRVHANVLGQEATSGHPGELLMHRLLEQARADLGAEAGLDAWLDHASKGLVFVDEVDKIRSEVGDRPNVRGIRAQEALLTLMENETVLFDLPEWAGGQACRIRSESLRVVGAGAFEGLYDAVYDRVTVGDDRGALQPVTVVDDAGVREELPFSLRDWLRTQDLFDYGMTPQFLARFDAVVLLNDLSVADLVRIFLDSPESGYDQAKRYFSAHGVDFAVSPAAVQRIALEASRQPRLGARALREVFRRVIREREFDLPRADGGQPPSLFLDEDDIERSLRRG